MTDGKLFYVVNTITIMVNITIIYILDVRFTV